MALIDESRVGGNLRELDLPADMIATFDDWGASGPDRIFQCLIDASPFEAGEFLYVGDRLDNDIRPAASGANRNVHMYTLST